MPADTTSLERRHRRSRAAVWFAWSGALMFLLSLAWFLYSYAVIFGLPARQPGVLRPAAVDTLLFGAFGLHHSLFARTSLKKAIRRWVAPELERSAYTWIASVLFVAVCALWQPVPGILYRLPPPFSIAAGMLQFAAVAITIRAAAAVDVLDLAGVRPVLGAERNRPPRHGPLVTGGIYAFVRHPLYFAWALFVFSTPVMTATRATFAILSTLYVATAVRWEERDLVRVFGEEYDAYRRRVRWRMIPGVY